MGFGRNVNPDGFSLVEDGSLVFDFGSLLLDIGGAVILFQSIGDFLEQFPPCTDRVLQILGGNLPGNSEVGVILVHVEEALEIICLKLAVTFLFFTDGSEAFGSFFDSVLEQQVVGESQFETGVLGFSHDIVEKESEVSLFELDVADGGFVFVEEFVCTGGVVGVVFEDQECRIGWTFLLDEGQVLLDGLQVLV